MKYALYLLLSVFLITGCISSKKHFQRGQYDMAINKAVTKLRKKPLNIKHIEILEKAYPLANTKDNERIKYLKLEGKPESWDEIFNLYGKLKRRQSLVKTVTPIHLPEKYLQFNFIDYDKTMIEAKNKAAEYYYAHGLKLLKNNNIQDIREAFYEFKRVKQLYTNYKDIDKLINEAKYKGTSKVFVKVENKTHIKLSPEYQKNLIRINLPSLNSEWVDYSDIPKSSEEYDYTVNLKLQLIDILPEQIKEEHLLDKKEIEDGFQYILDDNGNVMKDSLGNDIKIIKYKTLTCELIQTKMHKVVHIEGKLDYIRNYDGQVIKTLPVAADNIFDHIYAMAHGDIEALKPQHKKLLGSKPVPFPPDHEMIKAAGETLKNVIKDVMYRNKRVIY